MKKEFDTEWQGAKGLMKLRCPKCKREFVTFKRSPVKQIACYCGQAISLEHLARFECECVSCKDSRYGRTNIEESEMGFICANCGTENNLTWSPAIKSYTNIKERMA